jgi:hypothetical protein
MNPGGSFTATFLGDPAGDIGMSAGSSSGGDFSVQVLADDIDKLFGAAFHVTFDGSVVEFVGASGSNSIFGAGGNYQAALVGLGEIAVSATMTGQQAGIDNATGLLITLSFRATGASTGSALAFEPVVRRLVKLCPTANGICTNAVPQNWTGGTVVAVAN